MLLSTHLSPFTSFFFSLYRTNNHITYCIYKHCSLSLSFIFLFLLSSHHSISISVHRSLISTKGWKWTCSSKRVLALVPPLLARSKVVEGNYYEMHNFDGVDYALLNSPASLREEQQKRQARLQNCSHEWNAAEMKIIMKSVANRIWQMMTGQGEERY